MHRTFATRRHLTSALLLGAAGSSLFIACIPFDTDEDFYPPVNGGTDVVSAAKPPPAISGGTLVVSGKTAIAADSDRDRVYVVDLSENKLKAEILLSDGDEPGRVITDNAGRAHVALRRGGDLVTIDIASAKVTDRREVCAAPRGMAFDAKNDAIHVACDGGELVTFPAAGGDAIRNLRLERDLRDVIVDGDRLLISRFRSAELLVIGSDGAVQNRQAPPEFKMFEQNFEPAVAWRTIGMPGGGVAMAHQRAMTTPVVIEQPGGYSSGGCDGSIVHSTITVFSTDGTLEGKPAMPAIPFTMLPVDVAASSDGDQLAMVAAGNDMVIQTSRSGLESEAQFNGEFGGSCAFSQVATPVAGEPIAVAFDDSNRIVVQTREPATIQILNSGSAAIALSDISVKDTGHEMFHRNTNGFAPLACASCHPEGRDDGRTWNFDPIGARRTQFVSGGILATAPLHWDGDMAGLETIMSEVFVKRMGGMAQGPRRVNAFAKWIDALPSLPVSPPADVEAVERGKVLFHDAKVACATCHTGERLTDNKAADVGTGKAFQVPSLMNLAPRAPFMHDGCAKTLHDRFDPTCGGGDKHGQTSHLSPSDIDDLVAYLETL
jgi:mono/diheme cytochrome c family protein